MLRAASCFAGRRQKYPSAIVDGQGGSRERKNTPPARPLAQKCDPPPPGADNFCTAEVLIHPNFILPPAAKRVKVAIFFYLFFYILWLSRLSSPHALLPMSQWKRIRPLTTTRKQSWWISAKNEKTPVILNLLTQCWHCESERNSKCTTS